MSDGQIIRALLLIVAWLFLVWLLIVSLVHGQPMIALGIAFFGGLFLALWKGGKAA